MTKREIAALSCKVLGIIFLLKSLLTLSLLSTTSVLSLLDKPNFLSMQGVISTAVWTLVTALAPPLLSLFLWFKADWCAKKLFPNDGDCETLTIQPNIAPMVLTVTGIIITVWAVPHLVSYGALIIISRAQGSQGLSYYPTSMFVALVQSLFGIWLALGAAKLIDILGTIQRVTQDKNAQ